MASHDVGARTLTRQVNRRAVMRAILRRGAISRVDVAREAGVSKPTTNAIVQDLVEEGWVVEVGTQTGGVGRSATLFDIEPRAALTIGVDLGGTKTRVAVADLRGDVLVEEAIATDRRGGRHVVRQIERLCRRLADQVAPDAWDRVRAVAVGSPGVLDPVTGGMDLAFNIPTFGDIHLGDELSEALALPVLVENDVNMAALGEQWAGLAAGRANFVFVAVGTGLGMGLVVDGELRRGRRGAAGEIAYIPMGADPLDPATHVKGPLEEAVAGAAIVRRHAQLAERGGPTLTTVPDVFAAADRGDATAVRVVEGVALDLALGIAAVAAVLDPELVVLGGGIGSQPLLAEHVCAALPRVTPLSPQVAISGLGHRASLVGAVAVGLRATQESLFDVDEQPAPWTLPSIAERAAP